MRLLASLLALALLAACGRGAESAETDIRTIERATVTDVPGRPGPVLCTGPVRESAPPQCEGPVISNWDWSTVWGAAGENGSRFGDFCVSGRDNGDEFVLSALPRPIGTCNKMEYVAHATVLEDGGTFGGAPHGPQLCLGPVMTSLPVQCGGPDIPNWDWGRLDGWMKQGLTTDGFYTLHGVYVGGDFTLTRRPVQLKPGDRPPEPTPFPDAGGVPERTDTELLRIQGEVAARAAGLTLTAWSRDDHVDIQVIVDEDGKLQKEFDATYGAGVVRVTSALRQAPPGM
jgi:hypothetical protein